MMTHLKVDWVFRCGTTVSSDPEIHALFKSQSAAALNEFTITPSLIGSSPNDNHQQGAGFILSTSYPCEIGMEEQFNPDISVMAEIIREIFGATEVQVFVTRTEQRTL